MNRFSPPTIKTPAKTIIYSLDLVKFFACLGVVFIHCQFPSPLGGVFRALGRFAVPFFFMVSGFFCLYGSDLLVDRSRLWLKIRHILSIIAFSALFYALFHLLFFCYVGGKDPFLEFQTLVTWQRIKFFIVHNSVFRYSHLWFLFALIYCYLFVYCLGNRIKGIWKLYYIAFAIIIFFIYSELLPSYGKSGKILIFVPKCLFLFRALPFFLAGVFLREKKSFIIERFKNPKMLIVMFVLGFMLSVAERLFFVDSQFYFGTYMMVLSIFIIAMIRPSSVFQKMEWIGRNLSLFVYIFHIAVYYVLNSLFDGTKASVVYYYFTPIIVFIITLIISYLTFIIQKHVSHMAYSARIK